MPGFKNPNCLYCHDRIIQKTVPLTTPRKKFCQKEQRKHTCGLQLASTPASVFDLEESSTAKATNDKSSVASANKNKNNNNRIGKNNNNNRIGKNNRSHFHKKSNKPSPPRRRRRDGDRKNNREASMVIEREIVRLGRAGMTDEAVALYHAQLGEATAAPDPPATASSNSNSFQHRSTATVRQLNAAIDACARARPVRLQQATDLLEDAAQRAANQKQQRSENGNNNNNNDNNDNYKHSPRPNVYSFGSLLSAMARTGQVDQAVRLLRTMERDHGVAPNAVCYNAAVSAAANAKPTARPDTALQILDMAASKGCPMTVVGYNAAVSAAARAGDWQGAIRLLETMLDENSSDGDGDAAEDDNSGNSKNIRIPRPDVVTYGTILTACERGGQWELLLRYADECTEQAGFDLDPLALTAVLHACQQLKQADAAVEYLERMKAWKEQQHQHTKYQKTSGRERLGTRQPLQGPDAVAYRLTISACARGGAWRKGIQVLDEYCDTFLNDNRHKNNNNSDGHVVAFTSAINGCEYAGKWRQAFQLLERMRRTGVEPNEMTFAAVIGACATACANNDGNDEEDQASPRNQPLPQRMALQLLNVLKKDPSAVNPNMQVYNNAIRTCAESLDLEGAMQLFEDAQAGGLIPTQVTYGSLMTACERIGNMEGAGKVFKLMRETGVKPNEIVYGAAISCCRKAGQAERAVLLLRKMIKEGRKPNVATFNTVLIAQNEEKNKKNTDRAMDRAILVYKILRSPEYTASRPNRQTYNILIRGLAQNKRPLEAEGVLWAMKEDAGFVPDVDLYTATVSSYEQSGQPLRALRLMESMRADGYDFYDVPVLNEAFKRAIRLVNVVGKRVLAANEEDDDGEANEFIFEQLAVDND